MKIVSMLDRELMLKVPGSDRVSVYSAMLDSLQSHAELELDIPATVQEMIRHEDAIGQLVPGLKMPVSLMLFTPSTALRSPIMVSGKAYSL